MSRLALRQAIELTFWSIYFSDHAIEWVSFEANPSLSRGDPSSPIQHAAHRDPSFYRAYAQELFGSESSDIASEAVELLSRDYGSLSVEIHPTGMSKIRRLRPAIEDPSAQQLAACRRIHREVCASMCIALSALGTNRFNALPLVHRAWFDWLIGPRRAMKIRSGRFGL